MPQLRKRKRKEKAAEEVEKKVREQSPIVSKKVPRKKNPASCKKSEIKVLKSTSKRKKSESDDDLFDKHLKTKKTTKESSRKNPKSAKDIVHCANVNAELNDLEQLRNSTDSGISSETPSDVSKEETKIDLAEGPSSSISNEIKKEDESASSESEWEEVADNCETASLDDYKPDIPKEGVEITIDCPELQMRKRKKKEFDENEWIRLHINRVRKDAQLSVHKTHLLCLFAHGIFVNKTLNLDSVKALALSLIPSDMFALTAGKKVDKIDVKGVEKVVTWFRETFSYENEKCLFLNPLSSIVRSFNYQKAMSASEFNLMFIVFARILGFKVRLCVSLYPVTYKASNLIKKPNHKKNSRATQESKSQKNKEIKTNSEIKQEKTKPKKEPKIPKTAKGKKQNSSTKTIKKATKENEEKVSRPRRSAGKNYKVSSDDEEDDENDEDFEEPYCPDSDEDLKKSKKSKSQIKGKLQNKTSNRKVLSSDSEPSSPKSSVFESGSVICWSEIFSKPDKQWVSIECAHNIFNKPYDIEKLAPQPVSYILAYDNNSYVKDVTRRYCSEYMTATIKLRVDPEWWEETLNPFLPPNSVQNKAEEKKLDEMLVNKPLPTTVQGFKNHPLYALKRHLLKFEAIYPPDAPPVGFMRSEPVYARDCVHQLHSRETWLKEARVVKIGEQPYKIVKARPKWDRIAGVMRTDLPLEIFGFWQTQQYEPPVAVGGKVPRNEYGNVELFKSCMLPKGTVHLQLPGLNRVAKKLGIDCSPAVVGFDGHKGSIHPVFEGFVVCEEFEDTLVEAWEEDQENARKREEEKREKRIYGNWKKLIRGLLIRERIKLKYDTK